MSGIDDITNCTCLTVLLVHECWIYDIHNKELLYSESLFHFGLLYPQNMFQCYMLQVVDCGKVGYYACCFRVLFDFLIGRCIEHVSVTDSAANIPRW